MQVRLKKSWAQWSAGHVFADMPGGQARTLIARGIAEEIRNDYPIEAISSPANRMMTAQPTQSAAIGGKRRAKG